MKETGCRSPSGPNWVRTAPVAYFEASVSIWNGFVKSGIVRTGSSVNFLFSKLMAFWHSLVHSNFWSFFNRLLSGLASSEYPRMNHR